MTDGNRLDPWVDGYARRTHDMTGSEVRALFAVASRPEVVSLAGGMPHLSALPMDEIADLVARVIRDHGDRALQYGSGQGSPELRAQLTEIMALEGISAHPDDLVVTTGSQQALDIITEIFIDPGDVILAEAPSYVGALSTFSTYQAEVRHVALDEDGLIPEAFEQALAALDAEGRRAKFLYTIPNYQNPAGVCLSVERRHRILEIARAHHLLVVEDNPYGLLGFGQEPYPALRSMDPDNVVYLGSMSKIFAPGLRTGWAAAPHAVRDKLVLANEAAILNPSSLSQMTVSAYLQTMDWRRQIKSYREMYRERRDAMLDSLAQYLPSCRWTHPEGGFYVWVTLPAGLDSKLMLPRAVTARVAYAPGTGFYSDGQGHENMRLSYCYPSPERIHEGVRRLAGVVDNELDLLDTFGRTPAPDGEHEGPMNSYDPGIA